MNADPHVRNTRRRRRFTIHRSIADEDRGLCRHLCAFETREQQIGRRLRARDVEYSQPDRKESIEAEVSDDSCHRAPAIGGERQGTVRGQTSQCLFELEDRFHQRIERRVVLACRDLLGASVKCSVGGEEMIPQLWAREPMAELTPARVERRLSELGEDGVVERDVGVRE